MLKKSENLCMTIKSCIRNSVFVCMTIPILTSCQQLPQLFGALEQIEDNDTIKISVAKDAFSRGKDVSINVGIKNEQVIP